MVVALLSMAYLKIVQWWVKEVEATTDPDMTEEQYNKTKWEDVESIDTIMLREILQKALKGNKDWEAIQAWAKAKSPQNAQV
jgi:hypothetical protein